MPRFFPLAVLLLLAAPAGAQPEQYEFTRRLKAFEAGWEKSDNPAARERALTLLPKVADHLITPRYEEAGRILDLAAYSLSSDVPPSAGKQWVWSLIAIPETRVVDGSAKEIAVTIRPFYPVKGDMPKGLELQLWFTNKDVMKVKPEKFPLTVKVPLPPLGELPGLDRKLYFLADGAKELHPAAIGISQIADLRKRLDALDKQLDAKKPNTIEVATARRRLVMVSQAAGTVDAKTPSVATDFPYADMLANAETMLDGKPFFTATKRGQFWMSVPIGQKKAVDCRVYIPKGLDKTKPVPVVFALHGIAGDENTFFENYGVGEMVNECQKRGWVLVCPRLSLKDVEGPPLATLLEELAERYPLDPKRVFVLGYSTGTTPALVQAPEGKFAAVALLSGGGKLAKPAPFATLPLFIGAGENDGFILTGVRELKKSLADSGAKATTYKEYPGTEQFTIVREALPDVFAFFDKVAGK